MKPTALIVDDETQMTAIIAFALETEQVASIACHSGHSAWQTFTTTPIDLVILDLMLPDITGITLCRRIRARSNVPILMLTALGDVEQRVKGLEAGADDYVTKPFSPKELALRARALIRRSNDTAPSRPDIVYGPIRIDVAKQRVYVDGRIVELTETEIRLLSTIISNPDRIHSLRELLNEVWGTTATQGGRNMVKTTMYRLRKKLGDVGVSGDFIVAVRGRGYTCSPQ
ncbi:MAG: response regulator transcription factor [Actinomycetaceae bacterium]|nr:response regulator transcription factor [Actinomycetaceae bacterium]